MEVKRDLNTISEDLVSNDEDKCISSLQLVIKRVNRADDISIFWNGIFSNFGSHKSRSIRLLVYYILQTNSDISNSYWESLFPTILEDLNGIEQSLQIEAFRLLPHLPEPILIKAIDEGIISPSMFQNQESSLAFRQCAIETLVSLLIYSSNIYKNSKFREFGWKFICQKVFDSNPTIIHSAFSAISVLFNYQEDSYYPSFTEYLKDWDTNKSKRESFKSTTELVVKELVSRYSEMLDKALSIDASLRWVVIFPIAYICSKSTKVQSETNSIITPRNRMIHLISRLKAMLYSTEESLIYECGIAILYLDKQLGYIPGVVDTVVSCFTSLINIKQPSVTILQIANTIFNVIFKLTPKRIFQILTIIINYAHLITDFCDRITVLLKCWKFWIENSNLDDKQFISTFLAYRWVSEMFNNPKYVNYRNELVTALMLSAKDFYLDPNYFKTIGNILVALKFFLTWNDIDEYTIDVYLLIFDALITHNQDYAAETLKFISDNLANFKMPPSRFAKLLYVLSKHQSNNLTDLIPFIINYFVAQPAPKDEIIIIAANKVNMNEGKLGIPMTPKDVPNSQLLDILLLTLANIYIRGLEKEVVKDMMGDIISYHLASFPNQQRKFRQYLRLLSSNSFPNVNKNLFTSSPLPCVPFFIIWKSLKEKHIRINSTQSDIPVEISSNSSPIAIQASHTLNTLINRLTLHFKFYNRTDIPLSNIKVVLCLNGNVKSEVPTPQIYKTIHLLDYHMTVDWEIKLLITSFSAISFRLQVSFLRSEDNGYQYPISKFHSLPYYLSLSELLKPIESLSKDEFYQLWNSFPVGFHVHLSATVKTSKEILNWFTSSPFSLIHGAEILLSNFFQSAFIASTKFNELICFIITGKLCGGKWISRIEVRSSSTESLLVFESNFENWVDKISDMNLKYLIDYADENIFSCLE